MNAIFISQRVPYPPDRGDRITTHHFLRHLLATGWQVRVGCFAEAEEDLAHAETLRRDVADLCAPLISRRARKLTSARGLLTGQPLTLPFFRHRGLLAQVGAWVREHRPELIWVYSSGVAQFAMPFADVPVRLMQFAELDSDKWRQFAARAGFVGKKVYGREARLLLDYERAVARAFDISTVVSDVERDLFRERIPAVDPLVLPNGVDVELFASRGDAQREPHSVVFTGVMDYEPNVDGVLWFVRESWPLVRAQVSDAKLYVVGSRPVPAISALHGKDGVEVTGRVPSIPPWLDKAALAIAPLRLARGVQNKVLEAMSSGLAVVSTPEAAQGLGEIGDAGIAVLSDAPAMASEVVRLLRDPGEARRRGAAAAAFVRARFQWQNMFAIADAAIARVRERKRGATSRT